MTPQQAEEWGCVYHGPTVEDCDIEAALGDFMHDTYKQREIDDDAVAITPAIHTTAETTDELRAA